MGVEFRILGPLEVLIDGVLVPVGGPRQRALLATLLLSANEVVSRDRLIEELSGDAPADAADHAVRVQVSRLRKVFGAHDGVGERLLSRPRGYLFRVEPGELDLQVFEERVTEGRVALDQGDLEPAAAALRRAEALWRGRPLGDLEFERFARIEVERLEELRLAAVEERIDAELALGRHAALVAELDALVAEHPLRERLRGQLMLALYRCGRQADALEVYRAGRTLLSDQLALEPGRDLRELERSILNQRPELDLSVPARGGLATAMSEGQQPSTAAASVEQSDAFVPHAQRERRASPTSLTVRVGFAVVGVGLLLALAAALITAGVGGGSPRLILAANSTHRGGTLRLLSVGMPRDLDPTGDTAAWLLWWCNDGLTAYKRVAGGASAQLVPDLAVRLPAPTDDSGRTYNFRLRRGIRYSNGALVRPEDFRRALERDLKLGPSPLTGDYFANVIGGDACVAHESHCDLSRGVLVDDRANTITFHLVAPNPEFLSRLTLPDADPVPADVPNRDIGLHPIPATGPYKIATISRIQVRLVRNPYFHEWSRAARPAGYPNEIDLRRASSASAEVTAVEQGAADVAMDPPPAYRVEELQTLYASQLKPVPALYEDSLILNTRVAPFNDIRVRKALNYAVDRSEVARLVGGSAQPTCQTLTPWFIGYEPYCPYTLDPTPDGEWLAPDLATAHRLITASHTRGTPVTIWVMYDSPTVVGPYLVSLLKGLGYPAHLRDLSHDPNGYAQIADSRTKAQAFLFFNYAPYPTQSQLIDIYFGCQYFVPNTPNNGNIAEFCDKRLDAQTRSALAADTNRSANAGALWTQADRIVTDDAPLVPLVIPSNLMFLSKRVGNYEASALQGVFPDQLWVR